MLLAVKLVSQEKRRGRAAGCRQSMLASWLTKQPVKRERLEEPHQVMIIWYFLVIWQREKQGEKLNKYGIIVFNIFNTGTLIFFIREIQV